MTMSEVHVHGVTYAGERAAIEAAGARAVVHGELAAVVGDAAPDTRAADLARRHWHVLEAVAATATVLPVRFGTVMAGDAAVAEELLAPGRDDLLARLARFEGTVQLTVKGSYDEAALMRSIVEGSPEVAQLRERVRALPEAAGHFERIKLGELVAGAVEQARQQDAARLLEHLEAHAIDRRIEPATGTDGAVNAAFLVERGRTAAFGQALDAAAEEMEGRVELRVIGPLPPYSFASEEAAAWA